MKTEPNEPTTPMIMSHFQQGLIGLTKREYFAGLAMQGVLSNAPSGQLHNSIEGTQLAKQWADALIAELNKEA